LVVEEPGQLAANGLVGRGYDEAPRSDAQQPGESARAALIAAVARGSRRLPRSAPSHLDLVEVRRVPYRDARVLPDRPAELQEEPRRQPVEPPAHFAVAAQAHLDPRARAQDLAHASEDRPRVALLAHVRGRARAELAHALEQVLFPREQDHRRVAKRD